MSVAEAFPAKPLRVAIVHYWLVSSGGGEKVVQALLEMFPDAHVFTLVADRDIVRQILGPDVKLTTSMLQRIPFARKMHRKLLPLMPMALENLDLSGFDLILSSESGPAKGILPPLDATHICYCHSPMRYIWDQFHEYRASTGWFARIIMSLFIARLRVWDASTASRVDRFVANSNHIKRRIGKYYRRDAEVIHPPVETHAFTPSDVRGDFYLITGRHVGYKRIDLAIRACEQLGRRLVITGTGPETAALKRLAGPHVTFVGQCSFAELKRYYAECRAFLMPGEEDFGIAPVEAMASGRPVIALAAGGALDFMRDGVSGILFAQASLDSLVDAIRRFEAREHLFDATVIHDHAARFSVSAFKASMTEFIERTVRDVSSA